VFVGVYWLFVLFYRGEKLFEFIINKQVFAVCHYYNCWCL